MTLFLHLSLFALWGHTQLAAGVAFRGPSQLVGVLFPAPPQKSPRSIIILFLESNAFFFPLAKPTAAYVEGASSFFVLFLTIVHTYPLYIQQANKHPGLFRLPNALVVLYLAPTCAPAYHIPALAFPSFRQQNTGSSHLCVCSQRWYIPYVAIYIAAAAVPSLYLHSPPRFLSCVCLSSQAWCRTAVVRMACCCVCVARCFLVFCQKMPPFFESLLSEMRGRSNAKLGYLLFSLSTLSPRVARNTTHAERYRQASTGTGGPPRCFLVSFVLVRQACSCGWIHPGERETRETDYIQQQRLGNGR